MPRNRLILLLLPILAWTLFTPLTAEIRALWAAPWELLNPSAIDSLMDAAADARQTDVYVEVRYRSDALYQTNRVPDAFPNPEPRSYFLKDDAFDPLAYALDAGHKRDLRIHAWFAAMNATPLDSLRRYQNYVFQNHPEWLTRNSNDTSLPDNQFGYYLDPALPQVREHLLTVIGDLLSGYPELDGLHLDYIRYPSSLAGHHPEALVRFAGRENQNQDWNQWRAQQVTECVEAVRALTDTLRPQLILSAAVIAEPDKAFTFYAQDWPDWLRRNLIDFALPMAYAASWTDFVSTLGQLSALSQPSRIVVGIRAWADNARQGLSSISNGSYGIADIARRLDAIRAAGFAGSALFSYTGLKTNNALAHLTELAFADSILAALNHIPYLPVEPGAGYAADAQTSQKLRAYTWLLKIPDSGAWQLELRDDQRQLYLKRQRHYLAGLNSDSWNGILPDGSRIPPGDYILSLERETDDFQYLIPLRLQPLEL